MKNTFDRQTISILFRLSELTEKYAERHPEYDLMRDSEQERIDNMIYSELSGRKPMVLLRELVD